MQKKTSDKMPAGSKDIKDMKDIKDKEKETITNTTPTNKDSQHTRFKPSVYNDKDIVSSIRRSIISTKELGDSKVDYMCCRIDPDDTMLAVGSYEGTIKIYDLKNGHPLNRLEEANQAGISTGCLRWKPSSKVKNILASGSSDGVIRYWNVASGKQLHKITEENNQVLCLDYSPDGSLLASSGKDCKVRVYDENTKTVSVEFAPGIWQYPGHSNRIFSVKFLHDHPNVIISGGWDYTIQIWDIRSKKSVNSIFGPIFSGDSLDYRSGVILTGSWRNSNQLELWDFSTRKKQSTIDWDSGRTPDNCCIFAAQFSKYNSRSIGAGSGTLNELRIFDRENGNKPFAKLMSFKKGIYSIDFGHKSNIIAYCGGEGQLGYAMFNQLYTSDLNKM